MSLQFKIENAVTLKMLFQLKNKIDSQAYQIIILGLLELFFSLSVDDDLLLGF